MRRAGYLATALVLVATITAGPAALAQSPSASPTPSADTAPAASITPTASPFPWPTLPPPSEVPVGERFEPDGPPDATKTRHGVRVELWLSSASVAPGEWVQALVRTTNLRDTPAWSWSGVCGDSATRLDVVLGDIIPPGEAQDGNAAVFKEQALRWQDVDAFTPWRYLDDRASTVPGLDARGVHAHVGSAEAQRRRLQGRAIRLVSRHSFDDEVWFQPLYPGPVEVTVSWPYLSRGERPELSVRKAQRAVKPIKATAQLEIAGDGPGTPSLPELIDIALAEPEFRDWVDKKPSRTKFCRDCISVVGWPGPTYEDHSWLKDVPSAPPTGVLTVGLAQGGVFGTRGSYRWTHGPARCWTCGCAGAPAASPDHRGRASIPRVLASAAAARRSASRTPSPDGAGHRARCRSRRRPDPAVRAVGDGARHARPADVLDRAWVGARPRSAGNDPVR